jgi:hypothetical protein
MQMEYFQDTHQLGVGLVQPLRLSGDSKQHERWVHTITLFQSKPQPQISIIKAQFV